jgi:HEAT repeat protein
MRERAGPFVFISYSHSDRDLALAFSGRLREAGVDHFRDLDNIPWGRSIPEAVHEALERATHLVVLISPGSKSSQWVSYEVGYARSRSVEIIPYMTYPEEDVPEFLKTYRRLLLGEEPAFIDTLFRSSAGASPAWGSPKREADPGRQSPETEKFRSLILGVQSGGSSYRQAVVRDLASKGAPVVPAMIQAIGDGPELVRAVAAEVIGAVGEDAESAVPALCMALVDGLQPVREAAATALGQYGRKAIPALLGGLEDLELTVRHRSVLGLLSLGLPAAETSAHLIRALGDTWDETRLEVARALGALGEGAADAAPALVAALLDPDGRVRTAAGESLTSIGAPAVPALVEALRGGTVEGRRAAAHTLALIGSGVHFAAPALVAAALGDEDDGVRSSLAAALASIGTGVLPELKSQLLRCGDSGQLYFLLDVIARFGPAAADLVGDLVHLLSFTRVAGVATEVARILGGMGPAAIEAAPALVDALGSDAAALRKEAAVALVRLGPGSATHLLRVVRSDTDTGMKRIAFGLLSYLGDAAGAAVPDILRALEADDALAPVAMQFLRSVEKASEESVPDLIAALSSTNTIVRENAAYYLSVIGPGAVPALAIVLGGPDPRARAIAAICLQRIGAQSGAAVAQLAAALSCDDEVVRYFAASALSRIGPTACRVIAPISRALYDIDPDVREMVRRLFRCVSLECPLVQGYRPRDPTQEGAEARVDPIQDVEDPQGSIATAAKDLDPMIRCAAIWALARVGAPPGTLLPNLAGALSDEDVRVRRTAAGALANIGYGLEDSIPMLLAALDDGDVVVRVSSITALGTVGARTPGVESALSGIMDRGERPFDLVAAEALVQLGLSSEPIARVLISGLVGDHGSPNLSTVRALRKLGACVRPLVAGLIDDLVNPDHTKRFHAVAALWAIAPESRDAIPALVAILEDGSQLYPSYDWTLRYVVLALGEMGSAAEVAVPTLIGLMMKKDCEIRPPGLDSIVGALGKIGPAAKRALPVLRRRRDEADGYLLEALEEAIREIDPDSARSCGNEKGSPSERGSQPSERGSQPENDTGRAGSGHSRG